MQLAFAPSKKYLEVVLLVRDRRITESDFNYRHTNGLAIGAERPIFRFEGLSVAEWNGFAVDRQRPDSAARSLRQGERARDGQEEESASAVLHFPWRLR